MKVAIIGNYPFAACGISTHIERLSLELVECADVIVYDISGMKGNEDKDHVKKINNTRLWMLGYVFTAREDIIHFHENDWRKRALVVLAARARGKKSVITVHSLRDEMEELGIIKRILAKYCIKKADHIIAVGEKERDKLASWGAGYDKVSVIPAFLPPTGATSGLGKELDKFIERQGFIISSNGSNMGFYKGHDIYGLDMLIRLCDRLSREEDCLRKSVGADGIGFIYCISRDNIDDSDYYQRLKKEIIERGIEGRFKFVLDNVNFADVLRKSDIFIRATNTDGDSVSLRESLYMGVVSIASDASERPKGSILFRTRDDEDLHEKVLDAMRNHGEYKRAVERIETDSNFEKILEVYKRVLGR